MLSVRYYYHFDLLLARWDTITDGHRGGGDGGDDGGKNLASHKLSEPQMSITFHKKYLLYLLLSLGKWDQSGPFM